MIRPVNKLLVGWWVLAWAAPCGAQQLRFAGGLVKTDHHLLGSFPVLNAGIGFRPLPWFGVRLGFQGGRHRFDSFGTTCIGLVPPGQDCAPEPREETATLRAWSIAFPFTREWEWGDTRLVPGLRRLHVTSAQRGVASGRVRRAEKSFFGLEVGLETSVRPFTTRRFALELGLHGAVHPLFEDRPVADEYSPFVSTVGMVWVNVGFAVELGLAAKER